MAKVYKFNKVRNGLALFAARGSGIENAYQIKSYSSRSRLGLRDKRSAG
jgi:hypothetical protein